MKILKCELNYQDQKTNALIFLPEINKVERVEIKPLFAVFTHGYTSDKSSILNWPIRLAEAGGACIVFDLPGHYLGNFSEVKDFDYFKNHSHELFLQAFLNLKDAFIMEFPLNKHFVSSDQAKLVFGGHSLGAMLSLKALMLPEFVGYDKLAIAVGLGMAPKDVLHIFDTPFFQSTLKMREQLVSPALKPENVFPWIKEEKKNIQVNGAKVHLISGIDDLVVGLDGVERFAESLLEQNAIVTIEKPTKLPHHEPQLAAAHIKKYLKKIAWL